MNFDPLIDVRISGAASLIALLLIAWSITRLKEWIPGRFRIALAALRGAALLLILISLLNPYYTLEEPDPSAFEVVVLADVSGSMETPDTRSYRNRAAAVLDMVDFGHSPNLFDGPLADYPLNAYLFNETIIPWRSGGIYHPNGQSSQGDALLGILARERKSNRALGAAVLISDGHENAGTGMIEAAKRLREAQIPVSVIGVGELTAPGDISVRFEDEKKEARLGEAVLVRGEVTNAFQDDKTVTVELFQGSEWVDRREVFIGAGETVEVEFQDQAELAGVKTYRMLVNPLSEDNNPASDVAYSTVEVKKTDEYKVLYLGSQLHWEYKFIKMALREDPRFLLDCLIRTGPEVFTQNLASDKATEPLRELPNEESFYFGYDSIILDTRLVEMLSAEMIGVIRKWVTRRGGGLLTLGPLENFPEELSAVLPVKEVERIIYKDKRYLQLDANPVFAESKGGSLFQTPGPYLAEGTPVYMGKGLSRGGRVSAETRGRNNPIFVVQAFGAGSTAYLGTENTWRWRMESDKGEDQHRLFWTQLIFWLSSGGKERIEMPLQGSVQSLESEVDLGLKVRAQDFGDESEARVTARVAKPDGGVSEFLLSPSLTNPGKYEGEFVPADAGEFHVQYAIEYGDGELLERDTFFAVSPSSHELLDTVFNEPLLRDVARITGGSYTSYRDWIDLEIELSDNIPVVTQWVYWAQSWLFFAALALLLLGEWYRRRMLGLK